MNAAVISLTIAYALLGLLLLSLQLKSAWLWPVKAVAIGTALPLFVMTFAALQGLMGWPSAADIPAAFQLHAALVEEPSKDRDQAGRIFLWLTPSEAEATEGTATIAAPGAGQPPRAFALPYSRELHDRVEAMREALQQGDLVAGRRMSGSPWERRFGQANGSIELYAPPPPPMPSKDG